MESSSSVQGNEGLQRTELERLQAENRILHGKIRGYQTLNHLFHEVKDSKRKLEYENNKLMKQIKDMMENTERNYSSKKTGSVSSTNSSDEKVPPTPENISEMQNIESIDISKVTDPGVFELYLSKARLGNQQPVKEFQSPMQESLKAAATCFEKKNDVKGQVLAIIQDSEKKAFANMTTTDLSDLPLSAVEKDYEVLPTASSKQSTKNTDLSLQISALTTVITSDSPPIAGDLQRQLMILFHKIEDLERKKDTAKALAQTFAEENKKLKLELCDMHQFRETNEKLLHKIKKLEHEREGLVCDPTSSETEMLNDWVNVEKDIQTENLTRNNRLQYLQIENMKLEEDNKNWQQNYLKTQKQYKSTVKDLQQLLEAKSKKLASLTSQDEKRQQEIDKMLLTAKKRLHDEEIAKEDALLKLEEANIQVKTQQDKILHMGHQLLRVNQEKQALVAELGVFKHQGSSAGAVTTTFSPSAYACMFPYRSAVHQTQNKPPIDEFQTEMSILKQQLSVFKEDFDKERQDRALALTARDNLQHQLNNVNKKLQSKTDQLHMAEQTVQQLTTETDRINRENQTLRAQLRNMEETLQKTLDENDRLQRQQSNIKQLSKSYSAGQPKPPENAGTFKPGLNSTLSKRMHVIGPGGYLQNYQSGHELLPGSWQCTCGYANHPARRVCEMCGVFRTLTALQSENGRPGASKNQQNYSDLMSRGQMVADECDLALDNGQELPQTLYSNQTAEMAILQNTLQES